MIQEVIEEIERMIDMSICGGVAGARGKNPVGICIHNDAGSQNATASYYRGWLPSHNKEDGFAHYYVCSDGTVQAEDDSNCAWHCGNTNGNTNYLSFEICQSMGDVNNFKSNEEKAFKLIAEKCKQYGITPNANTIKLHREFSSTACPHRTMEIHGNDVNAVKNYCIGRINAYMNGTATKVNPQKAGNKLNNTGLHYRAHVQTYGWLDSVADGQTVGTTGMSKRLEALKIDVRNLPNGTELEVTVHIQSIGDKTYKVTADNHDQVIGTVNQSKRIEAISAKIVSGLSGKHIKYRAHIQKSGWSGWKQDGALLGSEGLSLGIQAIQMYIE